MKLDALLLTLAAAAITAGVFLYSIPAGFIAFGALLAVLVVLYRDNG